MNKHIMKTNIHENLVYRYLLGDLPDAEQLAMEQGVFADGETFERVWEIENELVDRYVRGRLKAAEKGLFEQNYLASPIHRERVAFARTLVEAADSTAERGEAHTRTKPAISWWSSFLASLRGNFWHWATVAAMLLLAIASVALFSERVRLRDQLAQTQAERAALGQREQELQRQLAQQRSSDAETENELARVRDRLAQLAQQLAAGGQHPEQRDLKIVAFNLAPQTRGVGKIPALTVPPGTDYVALTLELETNNFSAYRAALKNPATGQIVWRSGKLIAGGKSKALRVRLPASLLNAQNYAVELSGIPAGGVAEIVSSYPFRVVTQ
jgi:hypothetical protein